MSCGDSEDDLKPTEKRTGKENTMADRPLEKDEAFHYAIFQHFPFTAVVVDREGKIIECNAAKLASGDRLPRVGEVMYRDYAAGHLIDMYAELMKCIQSGHVQTYPELSYKEKVLSVTIAPFPGGATIVSQDITEAKRVEHERLELIEQLRKALDEVVALRELLPICAQCKRIRDDKGYWRNVETYFSERRNVDFSHTMCPDCIRRLYPEIWRSMTHEGKKGNQEESPETGAS
ncbi:MAG: hypothetical protein GF344_07185 [Chitinivibrionales bacterium]|nr:hypothetical protein [Chitinivibrionales bacterium]MBD3356696.1 hypothetical protein [Chitinivibrionales bacterium]